MFDQIPPTRGSDLGWSLLILALLGAGCGGASLGERYEDLETTTTAFATTTTASTSTTAVPADGDGEVGAAMTWPTLPLVPTTSTTVVDRSTDPPEPVADPEGGPGRNSVMVVGDSVLLGTASSIPAALPGWVVTYDAEGNRRLAGALDLFEERRDEIGEAVVIHLGNNYIPGERGEFADQLEAVMLRLWFVPRVVWVTVPEVNPGRAEMNEAIRAAGDRWPNLFVAEWAELKADNPDWSWDGMHLTPEGRTAMAELIAETLGPVDEG